MHKRFTYEHIAFDYTLTLEARKTVAVTICPDQSVSVKAPLLATEEKINTFLKRKWYWITKHQRYFAQFKPLSPKKYLSGETFRYLGRNYKLLIRKTEKNEGVSLQQGALTVFSLTSTDRLRSQQLLETWYTEKAKQHFAERLKLCAARFPQKESPKLGVRRMTKRWGSYSHKANRIWLNLELIKASKNQIDYVLTHELCHITHPRHDKAFYQLLSNYLPGWKRIKTELEKSLLST